MEKNLRQIRANQKATITKIVGSNEIATRIRDMGLRPGEMIKVIGKAPLNDPIAIKIKNQTLTLRNNEADYIFVSIEQEYEEKGSNNE